MVRRKKSEYEEDSMCGRECKHCMYLVSYFGWADVMDLWLVLLSRPEHACHQAAVDGISAQQSAAVKTQDGPKALN